MIKAVVMEGANRPLVVRELPEPTLAAGEVLISTIYSEVCGTDVHLWKGKLAGVPYPIIPGHISVGRVERIAGQVRDVEGLPVAEGDVITFLDVHGTCHRCWYCLVAKASTKCPERKVYGVTHSATEGLFGGWSQKILLASDVLLIRLPTHVPPLRLIAAGCALPTALHAIERASVQIGDTVVVQGAGPVGLCAGILARLAGARNVFVVDRSQTRLTAARYFGLCPIPLDSNSKSNTAVAAILDQTAGRGADIVIEATGVPAAVKQGIELTRDAGRYVLVGHYTDNGDVSINPHLDINRKHLDIRGTWGIDFSHFFKMTELLGRSPNPSDISVRWEDMVSRIYGLREIDKALHDVEHGQVVKAVIDPNIDLCSS